MLAHRVHQVPQERLASWPKRSKKANPDQAQLAHQDQWDKLAHLDPEVLLETEGLRVGGECLEYLVVLAVLVELVPSALLGNRETQEGLEGLVGSTLKMI